MVEGRITTGDQLVLRVRFTEGFLGWRFFSKYLTVEDEHSTLLYTVSRRILRTVREIRNPDDKVVARLAPKWWTANRIIVRDGEGHELAEVLVTGLLIPEFLLRLRGSQSSYRLEHTGGKGPQLVWRVTFGRNIIGELKTHIIKRGQMEIRLRDSEHLLSTLLLALSQDMYMYLRRPSG